jgi:hypothetical protein
MARSACRRIVAVERLTRLFCSHARCRAAYRGRAVCPSSQSPRRTAYRPTRDVRGVGVKTADAIAMRLGIEKTAMIRLRGGVSFALVRRWISNSRASSLLPAARLRSSGPRAERCQKCDRQHRQPQLTNPPNMLKLAKNQQQTNSRLTK